MRSDHVRRAIVAATAGHRLLDHPFYRRWETGALARGELGAYGEQYRHAERALPDVLGTIAGGLPRGSARRMVLANLEDEKHRPEAHATLFESFARAVGSRPEAGPTPATAALLNVQRRAATSSPAAGLAAIAAYEVQAADVAATKAAGLRDHYGCDGCATRFWDVHASMEREHADWSIEALGYVADSEDDVLHEAGLAAAAWWAFLDEREAQAPATVRA